MLTEKLTYYVTQYYTKTFFINSMQTFLIYSYTGDN